MTCICTRPLNTIPRLTFDRNRNTRPFHRRVDYAHTHAPVIYTIYGPCRPNSTPRNGNGLGFLSFRALVPSIIPLLPAASMSTAFPRHGLLVGRVPHMPELHGSPIRIHRRHRQGQQSDLFLAARLSTPSYRRIRIFLSRSFDYYFHCFYWGLGTG
ncbi:hypothetical protein B0H34DRAFT_714853 [Crassisporium funariophilum]|nr:hypothetical protein B0H34DRAFT_714853 [Crassisporium funariophilum]